MNPWEVERVFRHVSSGYALVVYAGSDDAGRLTAMFHAWALGLLRREREQA